MCVCVCVSYPSDIHDLDGCKLPCLNMATLVRGRKESDRQRQRKEKVKKTKEKRKNVTYVPRWPIKSDNIRL